MMGNQKIFLTFFTILVVMISGCRQKPDNNQSIPAKVAKDALRNINKALVDNDRELIKAYIDRHRLEGMEENGSGLFSFVWGDTLGIKAKEGSVVVIDYTVSLLDGTLCYTSNEGKPKEFMVGFGGVESGLEMAMLLMRKGQKGKFILPPHLAHGMLGDNDKIPPRSIIVYDVHLLNVIDK